MKEMSARWMKQDSSNYVHWPRLFKYKHGVCKCISKCQKPFYNLLISNPAYFCWFIHKGLCRALFSNLFLYTWHTFFSGYDSAILCHTAMPPCLYVLVWCICPLKEVNSPLNRRLNERGKYYGHVQKRFPHEWAVLSPFFHNSGHDLMAAAGIDGQEVRLI